MSTVGPPIITTAIGYLFGGFLKGNHGVALEIIHLETSHFLGIHFKGNPQPSNMDGCGTIEE